MQHPVFDRIHADIDGACATMSFNDPDRLNSPSWNMMIGIGPAFKEFGGPTGISAPC